MMHSVLANRTYRHLLAAQAAYAASLTPSGLLLRRSAQAEDRPAVFAAQFALSHTCWLSPSFATRPGC